MDTASHNRPLPGWEHEFANVLEAFASRTRRSQRQVAQALGFSKHLSVSTLSASSGWHSRLCSTFTAHNVPYVAAALGIDRKHYFLVENFFAQAIEVLLGYAVDVRQSRPGKRETVDWGIAGNELFGDGEWNKAQDYLEYSWRSMRRELMNASPSAETSKALPVLLGVGTNLISLHNHIGHTPATVRLLTDLQTITGRVLRSQAYEKETMEAAGCAMTQIAICCRIQRKVRPDVILGYSQKGYQALADCERNIPAQLCGLRDQAKPNLVAAFHARHPQDITTRFDAAEAVLQQADALAGGNSPSEELYQSWIQTRATWVECLTLMNRVTEARRLWDDLTNRPWFYGFTESQRQTPLRTKLLITEMALAAGQEQMDKLGNMTAQFRADPQNAQFGDRLKRVSEMEEFANHRRAIDFRNAVLL